MRLPSCRPGQSGESLSPPDRPVNGRVHPGRSFKQFVARPPHPPPTRPLDTRRSSAVEWTECWLFPRFPAGGETERLPRLLGEARARELIYTGDPVDAREAWRLGLVNRVAPAGQALGASQELGRTIAARAALTLRTVKAVMDRGLAMDMLQAQQVSLEAITELFQSEAVREGVTAFLEKRPARPMP